MNTKTQKERERHGQCLCGAVQISVRSSDATVGACHCSMCRRWGSGPFMELNCGTDVSIEGAEHITVYDSSPWAERGFCSTCGSNIFYRIKGSGEHMLSVGLFEDVADLMFTSQVFIDEKPDFYNFAEKTETMTGKEIFEKYGGANT